MSGPRVASRKSASNHGLHPADRVRAFCRHVGAPSVHGWLGISTATPHKEALIHLERRRRTLEASLHDPEHADVAERALDIFDLLRDALRVTEPSGPVETKRAADYYAILGVSRRASHADIERAWKQLRHGDAADAMVEQAWRVLGDPLNRANYDRTRTAAARERSSLEPAFELDPLTADIPLSDQGPSLELPGDTVRSLVFDGSGILTTTVPVVVHGSHRLTANISVDHPCMSTVPQDQLDVMPGRHSVSVRFDPRMVHTLPLSTTLTISNADVHQVVSFRIERRSFSLRIDSEPLVMAAVAIALVSLGWWLGTQGQIERREPTQPASVGLLGQLPGTTDCFASSTSPLPAHVDVHTDGLGRPTGFSFGGDVAPPVETCVRSALRVLEFPPTPDGLPVFHRYQLEAPSEITE